LKARITQPKADVNKNKRDKTNCKWSSNFWCRCCLSNANKPSQNFSEQFDQQYYAAVLGEENQNLSGPQKQLLLDHCRLGHVHMRRIQSLYQPKSKKECFDENAASSGKSCLAPKSQTVRSCDAPMCKACGLAKAKKKSTQTKQSHPHPNAGHIPGPKPLDPTENPVNEPGDLVSIDHYESAVRGRLYSSRGRERPEHRYCGGSLFYDHVSEAIFLNHQVSLGSSDTIRSKNEFEEIAARSGRVIRRYHTDNGTFTSKAFAESLNTERPSPQDHTRSGSHAHHQAGAAERGIQTVTYMARAMMVHAFLHWPEQFSPTFWPMALDYACWVYNHIPKQDSRLAPMEIFTGSTMDCEYLRRCRVWGCPSFVLDPRLADGKKIPKWALRALQGQFLGFSKAHSTTVGLIRHLSTGYITPQYHVLYDELFTTVKSTQDSHTLDLTGWVDGLTRDHYLDDLEERDGKIPPLSPEWKVKSGNKQAIDPEPLSSRKSRNQGEAPQQGEVPQQGEAPQTIVEIDLPDLAEPCTDDSDSDDSDNDDDSVPSIPPGEDPPIDPGRTQPAPSLRRSTRSRRQVRFFPDPEHSREPDLRESRWQSHLGLSPPRALLCWPFTTASSIEPQVQAYACNANNLDWSSAVEDKSGPCGYFQSLFDQQANSFIGLIENWEPLAYAAKHYDADNPSYFDIPKLPREEQALWREAMNVELKELEAHECFSIVKRSVAKGKEIVDCMWALKRKRLPDGRLSRYKARLVVRGDQQRAQFDRDATYAPVVEWSTVRLLLVLSLQHSLPTASIDFKNAFVQSPLPEPIYVRIPKGYGQGLEDCVLEVYKSLYGDRRAPKLWYSFLRTHLESEAMGFKVSAADYCMFLQPDCILVHYVDDAIIISQNQSKIDDVLSKLEERGLLFDRLDDLAAYLGVELVHHPDRSIELKQPHLTATIIEALGLSDAHPKDTPASVTLGRCLDSPPHDDSDFNYRSVVGMMMFLGGNSRLDCSFAIHQSARFSADPRTPHGESVKRIGRYLLGTKDKGFILKPNGKMNLDCYVDSDYAGLWGTEDPQDPTSVRSRAGYLLILGGVPVTWMSKLMPEICLSTMEAEYVALSMAMRTLIPMRLKLKEMSTSLSLPMDPHSTVSTVWEDNQAALILATTDPPRLTPRSKSLAVKYHWFRCKLVKGEVEVKGIRSEDQLADILTKPLGRALFVRARGMCMGW
jgi:hypothetical protein